MIKLQTTLFILFLLVTQEAFSQLDDGMVSDDCITVQTIEVPFSDAQFVTNSKNNQNYNLVYYGDNDEYTFWYKLIITENCALQFDVEPSTPGDDYDFMLYKFTSTNFCEAMVDNLILPLNETQYSSKSNSEYPNQSSITSSSRNIKVKAGETYYISVMNIYGEDCGHRLSIDACGSSVVLNSVHKPCFIFSQPSVAAPVSSTTSNAKNRSSPSSTSDKLANQGDTIIVDDFVSIDGVVRDNDNGHPINAKLTFVDEVNGNTFYAEPNAFNGYQLNLERGRRYQITCEAFGYYPINGVIEFLKPSTYDFYLLKIKEGKTFILSEILFYPSTYALKDDSYTELDKLVNYMTKNPMLKIQIEGHTAGNNPVKQTKPQYASLGAEWNYTGSSKKLSKLRAESVKQYLLKHGVSSSRVNTAGYGADKKLIQHPISKEEKALNMRVEVKIIYRGENSKRGILNSGPNK